MAVTSVLATMMSLQGEGESASPAHAPGQQTAAPVAQEGTASSRTPDRPFVLSPRGLSIKLAAGASYQRVHSVPITSGELLFGFGGRLGRQSGYLTADVQFGESEFGLNTWGLHLGAQSEWALGALRLGLGARTGVLNIARVSNGAELSSASAGVHASLAVDLFDIGDGNVVYLQATPRADYYSPLVLTGAMHLGVRWDSQRRIGATSPAP